MAQNTVRWTVLFSAPYLTKNPRYIKTILVTAITNDAGAVKVSLPCLYIYLFIFKEEIQVVGLFFKTDVIQYVAECC